MQPSLEQIHQILKIPEWDWTPSSILAPAEFDLLVCKQPEPLFVYRNGENLAICPIGMLDENLDQLRRELCLENCTQMGHLNQQNGN